MLIERSERLRLYVRGNRRDALQLLALDARAARGLYSQGETPHLPL